MVGEGVRSFSSTLLLDAPARSRDSLSAGDRVTWPIGQVTRPTDCHPWGWLVLSHFAIAVCGSEPDATRPAGQTSANVWPSGHVTFGRWHLWLWFSSDSVLASSLFVVENKRRHAQIPHSANPLVCGFRGLPACIYNPFTGGGWQKPEACNPGWAHQSAVRACPECLVRRLALILLAPFTHRPARLHGYRDRLPDLTAVRYHQPVVDLPSFGTVAPIGGLVRSLILTPLRLRP
jgi:hypothetical protein